MTADPSESIHLLHVDADDSFVETTTSALQTADERITVDSAPTVEDANRRLGQREYDCILTEYEQPGLIGIELLTGVRSNYPDIPVIVLTEAGSELIASEVISAGAADYFPKEAVVDDFEQLAVSILDAVSQARARGELRNERAFVNSAIDTIPDLFYVVGPDGEIRRWNDRLEAVTGYDGQEIRQMDVLDFFPEGEQSRVASAVEETLTSGQTTLQVPMLTVEGEEIPHEFTSSRLEDENGNLVGLVGTGRDITRLSERQEELRRSRNLLERVQRIANIASFGFDAETGELLWESGFDAVDGVGTDIETLEDAVGHVFPDDRERVQMELQDSIDEGTTFDVEYRAEVADETIWHRAVANITDTSERPELLGCIQDITARKEREQELEQAEERLSIALKDSDTGVWEWDPETDEVRWHESTEALFGIEPGTFGGTFEAFAEYVPDDQQDKLEAAIDAALPQRDPFEAEYAVRVADGSRRWVNASARFVDVEGLTPRYIGVVTDITDRKTHEETLSALYDSTSDFVQSETKVEAANRVVTALNTIANLPNVGFYLYDDTTGTLSPVATSDDVTAALGDLPAIGPDEGIVWDVFTADESRYTEDMRDLENGNNAARLRSRIFIPIGDHGVLTAGDRQPDAFDPRHRELAELIGVTCEAAFDRIERTETLRERSRKLDDRTRQLVHTKELNDAIRQTNQALSTAETRQEIFDAVCEHVGSLSFIEFSWIAERAIGQRTVSPAAWSDGSRAYLDAFDFPLGDDASEPGVHAGREEIAVQVDNIASDVQSADWRSAALRHGYRGALAVPIAYDGTIYGSLAVYAAEQDTFDDSFQSILGELGDIVGRELSAQDRKDALFGRRPVSIELTIDTVPSPEDPLVWLTGELDSALTVRNVLPQDRGYLIYATCTDVTKDRLQATASAIDGIEAVRRIRGTDPCDEGGCLFEFHVTDAGVISQLVDLGVRSQEVAIVGDQTRISATIPSTMDPERIVTKLESSYPSVSLESTSVSHETVDAADAFVLTNAPTDAQREAIEAAFEAGFFEWPRDSSSQEVADALDISQPSFSQRLRAGQQKVFQSYCRDTGGSDLYRL